MTLTRALARRKQTSRTYNGNDKKENLGFLSVKRSKKVTKKKSFIRTSTSTSSKNDNNFDLNDDHLMDKDDNDDIGENNESIIHSTHQTEHDYMSTVKERVICDVDDLSEDQVTSPTINTSLPDAQVNTNTRTAYEKLADVIAICEPVTRKTSISINRNMSPLNIGGASTIRSTNSNQAKQATPFLHRTSTNTRINLPQSSLSGVASSSRVSQFALCAGQVVSARTDADVVVDRGTPSSNSMRSSYSTKEKNTPRSFNNITSSNTRVVHNNNNGKSTPVSGRTLSLLDSIPEYRSLKRELEREQRKCSVWAEDYRRLQNEFDKYRQNSFPRPTADGLNFLLELVDNLTFSNIASDTRTNEEIAVSLGLSGEQLMLCTHLNPQRAALLLFSELFPTNQDRANLLNIKQFSKKNGKILENILVFACRCNPSALYSMDKLRQAIGSCIRQAKHQVSKSNIIEYQLSQMAEREPLDAVDSMEYYSELQHEDNKRQNTYRRNSVIELNNNVSNNQSMHYSNIDSDVEMDD